MNSRVDACLCRSGILMHRELIQALNGQAQYDSLPESLKAQFSHKEWAWMTDQQKSVMQRVETEPEWSEP